MSTGRIVRSRVRQFPTSLGRTRKRAASQRHSVECWPPRAKDRVTLDIRVSSRVTSVCFDSQSRLTFLHCVYIRDVRSPIEYGSFAPRLNQLSIRFGCSFFRYLIAISPERARVNQTNHIESVQCVQLFAVGDQRFVYTNEIIVLGDVSVGKHDRYKEKTTYMVWFTSHLEHSATLTLKSSEITFKREHLSRSRHVPSYLGAS